MQFHQIIFPTLRFKIKLQHFLSSNNILDFIEIQKCGYNFYLLNSVYVFINEKTDMSKISIIFIIKGNIKSEIHKN